MVGENWLHWHDYYELFVALSGEGDFCLGSESFVFKPGDIVVVDPLKIHGVMKMDASHSALVLLFPSELVAPTEHPTDVCLLGAWEQRAAGLPVLQSSAKEAAPVHASMLALVEAWFSKKSELIELKILFLQMLLHLRRAMVGIEPSQGAPGPKHREQRLRRALDYMARHMHEPLAQPSVAHEVGMSTSRFRAFFKQTTGWGFARYVMEQRVERAARLLREGSESVASIAHMTGFADQSHLLRCFRKKFGVSPREYRQQG
jgi:AraC-like DNA-binding protein